MRSIQLLFIITLVTIAVAIPSFALAKTCGGNRPPCQCGDTLVESYTLTSNMYCSGDTVGLLIGASNVTLDGAGFAIIGGNGYTTKKRTGLNIKGKDSSDLPITGVIVRNLTIDGGSLDPGHWRTCMEVDASNVLIGDTAITLPAHDPRWTPSVILRNCGRRVDMNNNGVFSDDIKNAHEDFWDVDFNGNGFKTDIVASAEEGLGYGIDAKGDNITAQGVYVTLTGDEGIHFARGANNGKTINNRFYDVTHEAIYYLDNTSTSDRWPDISVAAGNFYDLSEGAYGDSETKGMYLKHARGIVVQNNVILKKHIHLIGDADDNSFKNNQLFYGARFRLESYRCSPAGNLCCGGANPTHCNYRTFPTNNTFLGDSVDGAFIEPRTDRAGRPDLATDYCIELKDAEDTTFTNVKVRNCDDSVLYSSSYYHSNLPQPNNNSVTRTFVVDGVFDKLSSDMDEDPSLAPKEISLENAAFLTLARGKVSTSWGGTISCQNPEDGNSFVCVPTDDSFVRDDPGSRYNMYGDQSTLRVSSMFSGEVRRAFLRFDLRRMTSAPSSAILRIHRGSNSSGGNQNPEVSILRDIFSKDDWTEWGLDTNEDGDGNTRDDSDHATRPTDLVACECGQNAESGYQNYLVCCIPSTGPVSDGITWANMPGVGRYLGAARQTGSSGWWEIDVTDAVAQELSTGGNKIITFVLTNSNALRVSEWESKNGSPDMWPQLVIR